MHFDDYDVDRQAVLARSATAGVKRIICVGCSLDDSQKAINLAKDRPGVWATAGAHPHDGLNFLSDPEAEIRLKKLLRSSKVVAVGEIGLDYYRDITPKPDQEKILRTQIKIGLDAGLPFVFHVREAWDEFWPVFNSYKGIKGVIHSFSASVDRLEECLSRGLYVSLNGLMTYTREGQWLEAAKKVPTDKLLLETDAPFLTPVPYRGKRCEPKHVADICKFLANLRDEDPATLAATSSANAVQLFGLSQEELA